MRARAMTAVLAILLGLTALTGGAPGQEGSVSALVMFDLGDGVVLWQEVLLAENRTGIRATEDAAGALGLSIEVLWSEFGAFVADIGDRDPVFPEYFHLLLWNVSRQDWELSPVGASALLLEEGENLGWLLSADDPDWDFTSPWPGPKPLATPTHPFPAAAFRGNLANSGASGSDVPGPPGLRWRYNTGGAEIGASPVGAGGILYQVTLFNGTYALDLQTGVQRWRAEEVTGLSTPALYRQPGQIVVPSLGARPLPADLIAGSRDGALYRLRGASGEVAWRVVLQEVVAFTGVASSPKVSKGRALVGVFNESGGAGGLVSVDVNDGSLIWHHETSSVHMSSPAVQKGSVYVGLMGLFNGTSLTWDPPYGLLSVFEENGTERWMFPTSGPVASSPAVVDSAVYFTTRDGYLYAVSTEGSLLFRRSIGPSTSSPAIGLGMIFAASGVLGTGGNVTAFDLQGNLQWRFPPNGPVQSSLTLASGTLLFATNTEAGTLYALDGTSGEVVWTYVPEPHQYILPTPVVIDGVVVVASDNGFVYALGPTEPPALAAGTLAATIVLLAGILVAMAILFYARRLRAS
ncbi:MAG: PQQ-binding-like beta-propeller repeat protein [Thermoplasmata archaeon]